MKVDVDLLSRSRNFLFHTAKIFFWCAILLMFFTHDCNDPSWNNAVGIDTPIHNLYGKFGAICSDLVLQIFGISVVFFLFFKIIFYIARIKGFLRTNNKKIVLAGKVGMFVAMMILGNAVDFYKLNPTHLPGNGGFMGNLLLHHTPLAKHQTFQIAYIIIAACTLILFRIRLRHMIYCLHALSIPFYLAANFLRLSCRFLLKKTEEVAVINEDEESEVEKIKDESVKNEPSPQTINIIQNNTNNTINLVKNEVQNVEKAVIINNEITQKTPIISEECAQQCKNIIDESIEKIAQNNESLASIADEEKTKKIAHNKQNLLLAPNKHHFIEGKKNVGKIKNENHNLHDAKSTDVLKSKIVNEIEKIAPSIVDNDQVKIKNEHDKEIQNENSSNHAHDEIFEQQLPEQTNKEIHTNSQEEKKNSKTEDFLENGLESDKIYAKIEKSDQYFLENDSLTKKQENEVTSNENVEKQYDANNTAQEKIKECSLRNQLQDGINELQEKIDKSDSVKQTMPQNIFKHPIENHIELCEQKNATTNNNDNLQSNDKNHRDMEHIIDCNKTTSKKNSTYNVDDVEKNLKHEDYFNAETINIDENIYAKDDINGGEKFEMPEEIMEKNLKNKILQNDNDLNLENEKNIANINNNELSPENLTINHSSKITDNTDDAIYYTNEILDECYDEEIFSQDVNEDDELEKFLLAEEKKEKALKQKEEEEIEQYFANEKEKKNEIEEKNAQLHDESELETENFNDEWKNNEEKIPDQQGRQNDSINDDEDEENESNAEDNFDNYSDNFEKKNEILTNDEEKNVDLVSELSYNSKTLGSDNKFANYRCNIDCLARTDNTKCKTQDREFYHEKGEKLLEVLNDFKIQGQIVNVHPGPVVDLFEFEPVAGTKSSRVTMISADIARSMCALSARISIIQGKNAIGIELPNPDRDIVFLREMLEFIEDNDEYQLPIALGKRIDGSIQIVDLTKMPHLLIAGTTGSGKSVAINTMILSLLLKLSPQQCRLIMIDPKMLELSIYNEIPHLLTPVITDPKQAIVTLKWVVKEMEERYQMMTHVNVRNISGYNERIAEARAQGEKISIEKRFEKDGEIITKAIELEELPFIVVIVDEMADLMIVTGKEIEILIQRLAQMARAAGIHIIMATQRPSVDVITGVIKANFPTRISFAVTSKIDSRTILGEQGAEQLLGRGDMLYMPNGGKIARLHGAFVSDNEVEEIVESLKRDFGKANYVEEIEQIIMSEAPASLLERDFDPDDDELLLQAMEIIVEDKKTTISYIQRRLRIGYNRAANLIERMEKDGFLSPPDSSGKRQING